VTCIGRGSTGLKKGQSCSTIYRGKIALHKDALLLLHEIVWEGLLYPSDASKKEGRKRLKSDSLVQLM